MPDTEYYEVAKPGTIGEALMTRARDYIYSDFLAKCAPGPADTILDVGVSDVVNKGANFLERLYPHQDRITACGLGPGRDFRLAFPGVHYRQVTAAGPLPFTDKSFDIAAANAVLEHVGGLESQKLFAAELLRVARRVFLSVPNRFFPIEHHTGIPFAHWNDATFRLACRCLGKQKWTDERRLRLMSPSRLRSIVPAGISCEIGYTGLRLGPVSSNMYVYLSQDVYDIGADRAGTVAHNVFL